MGIDGGLVQLLLQGQLCIMGGQAGGCCILQCLLKGELPGGERGADQQEYK